MAKLGFIGAGNMAEAVIKGIIDAKVYKSKDIIVSDIRPSQVRFICNKYKVKSLCSNPQLTRAVGILVLSIKPQDMQDVLDEIKDTISKNSLIVSIAAGITTKRIQKTLGDVPVIRVMPNTPALVGKGVAVIFATKKAKKRINEAKRIFSAVGIALVIKDEKLLDVVTAVSGSGPAYFFLLMEEMIRSATKLGLTKDIATMLVLYTAIGSGLLVLTTKKLPEILRKKVTSPGGTTEAALKVFSKRNFEKMVNEAIITATKRSRQLSNG